MNQFNGVIAAGPTDAITEITINGNTFTNTNGVALGDLKGLFFAGTDADGNATTLIAKTDEGAVSVTLANYNQVVKIDPKPVVDFIGPRPTHKPHLD